MRFLILFISILFAYEANIVEVNRDTAKIDKYVKKGISAIVICPYLNEEIICARAVSQGKSIKLEIYDNLKNPAFALPIVTPKKGDRVIFAKNYSRILIIAPDQDTYLKIKDCYKNATVISPDLLAANIEKFDKSSIIDFAKRFDIGRIIFALDRLYEVDAYSFYVIKSKDYKVPKYQKAFFTYFKKFDIKPFKWKIVNGKLIIKD